MKRFAIVALLLVTGVVSLFGQAKPGGIARELAMGGSNAGTMLILNPFIMDDPSLMLVNPAYQATYKDYVWANVAGGAVTGVSGIGNLAGVNPIGDDGYGHQFAGVAFGLNDSWNVGAILSYDPSAINFVNNGLISGIVQGRGAQGVPAVANVWEAVVSNRMGSFDWGLGVMYGWSNNDASSTAAAATSTREASSNVWGFRGGLVAPFGSGNSFDASAALRLDKATDNFTNTTPAGTNSKYSVSGTEFQFNARAKFNCSSKFNFVPYGTLIMISAEPKEDERPTAITSAPATLKASAMAYAVGVGGEYRTSSFYFAGGLSWQSARLKTETTPVIPSGGTNPGTSTSTATYTAIPVLNLGGEWWFTDWLAGRAGYYRSIAKVNQKFEPPSPGATLESNVSFPNSFVNVGGINTGNYDGLVTLGLGFRFGGAAIDATVSEEALRRGLGLIGAQDNINSFGYLTVSYGFGE